MFTMVNGSERVGPLVKNEQQEPTTFKFLNPHGSVSVSHTTSADIQESVYETIRHWCFPVPTISRQNGQEKQLNTYSWHIYGQVQNSVIVLSYHEHYGDHLKGALSPSNMVGLLISTSAKEKSSAYSSGLENVSRQRKTRGAPIISKVSSGRKITDHTTYRIEESHLYVVIADMLSVEYEANTASQPGKEDN